MKNCIAIYTESKFLAEKEYVFQVIFKEILGVDYQLFNSSVSQVYKIVLPNDYFIEFRDDFFATIPESIGYCDSKYIPEKLLELAGVLHETVPFFYGNNVFTQKENSLYCGADIVGSAFFMLSRWEEYITTSYDRHGRFPESEACAVKFGVIHKPLVHLYAELVRHAFAQFGFEIPQKHTFQKTLTHDVDFLYKWANKMDFIKTCVGDLFRRFSIPALKKTLDMHHKGNDPYDIYNELMRLSEQNGVKSTFYFLKSKGNDIRLQTNKGKEIIEKIKASKHNVGIHSNYFLEKDSDLVQNDIQFYENLLNCKLTQNRQHFLKMRLPQTLQMLENCGITTDSSLYYPNYAGFRTGMCIEHSMFDCKTHKILKIKELPITLMDRTLLRARKSGEALAWVDELVAEVKRYNGNFVCLWHNSSFHSQEWVYLNGIYEHIVKL